MRVTDRNACTTTGFVTAGRRDGVPGVPGADYGSLLRGVWTRFGGAGAITERRKSVVWTAVVAADREFYERVLASGGPETRSSSRSSSPSAESPCATPR